jgi:guanine deaminase
MAHSIYLEEEEIALAKDRSIYLVHCPNSNLNLTSGIMPLTDFLDKGLQVGLGSDVGGGHEIGMSKTISAAIQCSKMRHVMNNEERILLESEAFYLATVVNGSFFGQVGSFEPGYSFDALVIKDADPLMETLTPLEQLQRYLYCGGPESIIDRYLEGRRL